MNNMIKEDLLYSKLLEDIYINSKDFIISIY